MHVYTIHNILIVAVRSLSQRAAAGDHAPGLYYTMPYYTILHYTILYYTRLYFSILFTIYYILFV